MISPIWSRVLSLNSLTNAPMLTPCAPRAGPTGGAGVACPAGHCSLTLAVISFAMIVCLPKRSARKSPAPLNFPVIELDRSTPAEGGHDHLDGVLVVVDFLDHAVEAVEGPGLDLDEVALAQGGGHSHSDSTSQYSSSTGVGRPKMVTIT